MRPGTIIAIDGPAGSGKSTVAAAVAENLGLARLDTGAMYRAVTLLALRGGVSTHDEAGCEAIATRMHLEMDEGVAVDGEDVSEAIRAPEVDAAVSVVAAHRRVRRELVSRQRAWAKAHGGGVVEGRDIGSVVFPDAAFKFYLTAEAAERARRRAAERPGAAAAATHSALDARDESDFRREDSPLLAAKDAIVVNSTGRSISEVVAEVLKAVEREAGRESGRESGREGEADFVPRPPTRGELGFYAFSRDVCALASWVLFPGRIIGRENLPARGPYIMAPVHRSYVDWVIVARLTRRRLRYLVKAEVWQSKFAGKLLDGLGAFPVRRSGADREALERCRAVLMGGEPLVMFPEGTRREGEAVCELREGVAYLALRAGVPVVPVGIGGSDKAMPKGKRLPRPHRVDVVVGQPLVPTGSGGRPPALGSRADGGESAPTPIPTASPARPGRVSRRQTREFSTEVRSAIQVVYDAARRSAEAP
ncbi:MAG: (d)CMP kinase [Acidimicrobiales bacterium]